MSMNIKYTTVAVYEVLQYFVILILRNTEGMVGREANTTSVQQYA